MKIKTEGELTRRRFLYAFGALGALGLVGGLAGCGQQKTQQPVTRREEPQKPPEQKQPAQPEPEGKVHTVKMETEGSKNYIEAIQKLWAEQPDIDGIALPEMPAGSPGMGGVKSEPFLIYAVSKGTTREYARV